MSDQATVGGQLLDEHVRLSLTEVCRICGTREEIVVEMVREGVVEPAETDETTWLFSGRAVTRIQTTLRLQRDLEVNLPGAALALDLLEEIERLKRLIERDR
jgi:chaperone modulatory protein CbpM